MRRWMMAGTLAVSSGLMGLAAAEGLLRVIDPPMAYAYRPQETYVTHFRPSAFQWFELRPNNRSRFKMLEFDTTVVTNSLGLRDDEVDFSRRRVLCLGDSFTFGFGVENGETFCARLEQQFAGKYDFVNAGFADGYAPDTYALWLNRYGQRIAPDVILVSIFQNDRGDVAANTWMRNGTVMSFDDPGWPDRIARPGFIVTEDGATMRDNIVATLHPTLRRWLKASYVVALLRDRLMRDADGSPVEPEPADDEAADKKFLRALELLRDTSEERRLVFYVIGGAGAADAAAESVVDRLVRRFAEAHAIPVLANDRDFTRQDFFALDSHFTREGHAKAARYLHAALSQMGL